MDVTPLVKAGSKIIQSYTGGQFRISGELYQGPLIVTGDAVLPWGAPVDIASLDLEHFLSIPRIQTNDIEVILLGTGQNFSILPAALRAELKASGINIDVMDTGAACRTYNVLLAEGRRILAALLPV